ncbi:MAG: hypothetical protein ABIM50_06770 [Novosphingobium sp.]
MTRHTSNSAGAAQRADFYISPIATKLTAEEAAYIVADSVRKLIVMSGAIEAADELVSRRAEPMPGRDTVLSTGNLDGVPDAEMGEAVKAVVQPIDWADASPEFEAELVAWCRERLSHVNFVRAASISTLYWRAALPASLTNALPIPTGRAAKCESPYSYGKIIRRRSDPSASSSRT